MIDSHARNAAWRPQRSMARLAALVALVVAPSLLIACGGGGSDTAERAAQDPREAVAAGTTAAPHLPTTNATASGTGTGGGVKPVSAPGKWANLGKAPVPPGHIFVEGCVVDQHYVPREGLRVRARGTDGRLLGHATSGPDGSFVLHLLPQAELTVGIDREGGEVLPVRAARRHAALKSCLIERDDRHGD